jgi:23S rRNA (cytidine1920-2'-O)/16S rRNA (cytidine1409-2'-O)-methyltransferase
MTPRRRADHLLVERGLFESRTRAQAAIAAGLVTADDRPVAKASDEIALDAMLRAAPAHPWVSRGGVKLAAALDHFGFDPRGRLCLDVGASTGGFSDVLLARGARSVIAVDVGRGQLHARLRADARVTSLEATDIRKLEPAQLPAQPDFAVIDVSFISLKLVLPAVTKLLAGPTHLVALVKPQFELGRRNLKKGIVRDEALQRAACDDIAAFMAALGWTVAGTVASAVPGGDGNREFFVGAAR